MPVFAQRLLCSRLAVGFLVGSASLKLSSRSSASCNSNEDTNAASFAPKSWNFKPSAEWDFNWDMNNKKESSSGKAVHHIVLIRHGQYENGKDDDVDRVLTSKGKLQAAAAGKRLRELIDAKNLSPIRRLYASTMVRASQTAEIIIPFLPPLDKPGQVQKCSMIREGACYKPEPPITREAWDVSEADFFRDSVRIEAAFRAYVQRAPAEEEESFTTILVCHGNVIRYFVCRALQQDPAGWLRMAVAHSSLTVLSVYPNGKVSLTSLGDAGFMNPDLVTIRNV